MFIILTGRQHTHSLPVCVYASRLHLCAVEPWRLLASARASAPPGPCLSPPLPNRVQCPQGVVFVVSEGVSITYCGRRAAGETCVVFCMNWHTHTHTQRQIDSHILSHNALITMAHKITIYLSITNLPPTRQFLCQNQPELSQLFPVPSSAVPIAYA